MFIRSRQLARYMGSLIGRFDPTDVARLVGVRSEELNRAARGELSAAAVDRLWATITDEHTARALAALEAGK